MIDAWLNCGSENKSLDKIKKIIKELKPYQIAQVSQVQTYMSF